MRAQIAFYLHGIPGTAEIKNSLMTAKTKEEVEALLEAVQK